MPSDTPTNLPTDRLGSSRLTPSAAAETPVLIIDNTLPVNEAHPLAGFSPEKLRVAKIRTIAQVLANIAMRQTAPRPSSTREV
jgi:hypothetical protein